MAEFRPSRAPGPARGPLDAEAAARATLNGARRRARALLAEAGRAAGELARRRLAEAFAAGREEGLARGLAEGREAAKARAVEDVREELRRSAAVLAAAGGRVARALDDVRAEAEAGMVRLAVAIGGKLAHGAITTRTSAAALDALREALGLVADRAEVRVLVSPDDLAAVEAAREAVRAEFPEIIRVAFEPDASVPPGGCRAVTPSCTVDATLEACASRIAGVLTGKDAA